MGSGPSACANILFPNTLFGSQERHAPVQLRPVATGLAAGARGGFAMLRARPKCVQVTTTEYSRGGARAFGSLRMH